mgnify:CR=1 FL=1
MRTTIKSVSQSLIFVVCIVVTLALASGMALAANDYDNDNYSYGSIGNYGYTSFFDYSYSPVLSQINNIFSNYLSYFGFGNSQNQLYKDAVDYYRTWQVKAACTGLYYPWSQLEGLCTYLKQSPRAYMEALVDWTNREIESAVRYAQSTRKKDIDLLLSKEALLVANVRYWSRATGIEVLCQYTDYWVDGQWVSIDPLRVV